MNFDTHINVRTDHLQTCEATSNIRQEHDKAADNTQNHKPANVQKIAPLQKSRKSRN